MGSHDRYAGLRDNLDSHRGATTARTYVWWCGDCQFHEADESRLCPPCRPEPPLADHRTVAQRAS